MRAWKPKSVALRAKKTLIRTPPKKTSAGTPCGISAVNKGALSPKCRAAAPHHAASCRPS